jgi:DNA-directed RNA polymerase I and III subunit RPAC2
MSGKEKIEVADEEKLKIIPDKEEGDFNCTYAFLNEDHTLGNILRYILMKDSNTLFCGYSIPHPSEDLMNVRLQTKEKNTNEVMEKAMNRIDEISDILSNKFKKALNDFDNKKF